MAASNDGEREITDRFVGVELEPDCEWRRDGAVKVTRKNLIRGDAENLN